MGRAILYQRFHSLPCLSNMFIIKLFKIHNATSQRYNLSRRIIFTNKASLHLVHESILFLGKESNQSLALPLNEKGNNFSFIISPCISLYFCISQSSTKLLRWAAASSVLTPENCSLLTRFSKAGLIS